MGFGSHGSENCIIYFVGSELVSGGILMGGQLEVDIVKKGQGETRSYLQGGWFINVRLPVHLVSKPHTIKKQVTW